MENKKVKNVECRFLNENDFISEKGIKRVLKDVYDTEIKITNLDLDDKGSEEIEKAFLKGIYNFEEENLKKNQHNSNDGKSKTVFLGGRASVNISLNKNYVNMISLAFEFIKIILNIWKGQGEDVTNDECLDNIKKIAEFVLNSVHINKGMELCVVKIFNEIYKTAKEKKDKYANNYIPLEAIKEYIKENIVKNQEESQEESCPFDKICKNSSKCDLIELSEDETSGLFAVDEENLQNILKSLETNNVIEKNKGKSEYRIKPLISR